MQESTPQTTNAVGLDVGTSRIVSAHCREADIVFGSQLNAFTTIAFSKLTESVLKKEKVPYLVKDSEITVYGDEAERFANLFHAETRRPMRRGILNPDEPASAEVVRKVVTMVTGEKSAQSERICFSIPAAPFGAGEGVPMHQAQITRMLGDLGYQVSSIPEGLAVVYGELESSNYTGIGISCGGGLSNVCLSYLSVPICSFSIAKGGDYIDASAAHDRGESATRIRAIKEESFRFNGHFASKMHQTICNYYEEMIQALVAAIRDALLSVQTMPKLDRAIPLVLAGGSVLAAGFRDRFESMLRETDLPVAISEVRLAANPRHSTARGALVAAMGEV